MCEWGFPDGSDGKESVCNVGDLGSIPGSGRSLGERNSYPLQYSYLENPMDRGAWVGYRPWGHKEWDSTELLALSLLRPGNQQGSTESHQQSILLAAMGTLACENRSA